MRRRHLTALVAGVAVLAVGGIAVLVATDGGDGGAVERPVPGTGDGDATGGDEASGPAPDTSAPATDRPPTTGAPPASGPPPTTASAGAAVDPVDPDPEVADITAFVADTRGLPFLEPVPVDFLDDDAFEEVMAELQAEDLAEGDAEERELAGQLWQALELVDDGDALFDLVDRIGVEAALGFYTFDDQRMVVRGAEMTPLTRVTLAHELTHALEDQHFGLDRPELDALDGEESFGFLVLTEGSAERIAEQYEAALSDDDRSRLDDETLAFAETMDLGGIPPELLLVVQLPYLVGPDLVASLLEVGGRDRLDAAFVEPPLTSEEALEPAAYLDGEPVRPVSTPPADGEPTDEGVFGAAGLLVLFPDASGLELARRWGGDRYVQWVDAAGRACVRVDLLGEGSDDSDRYAEALAGWAAGHSAADVERVGETVRLTACA